MTHILTLNGGDYARYSVVVPIAPASLTVPPPTSP
jgi:hypothetical protein